MSNSRFIAGFIGIEALRLEESGWVELAQSALDPNPFYEAHFLGAAERHLEGGSKRLRLLAIRDGADNSLAGLFPLMKPRLREGILFGALSLYANAFSSLSTPLIRAEGAAEIMDAAFRLLAGMEDGPRVLHFGKLSENRPFHALLLAHCRAASLPVLTVARHDRAAIETGLSGDSYLARQGSKTRKSLNRKQKQLESRGVVTLSSIAGDTPGALEAFLTLEAAGWKGRHGTALASRPDTRAFAQSAFGGASSPARLFFECLSLDGRPIAMNLNLVAGNAAFTLKTAYDEAYAAYSPGALLDRHSARLTAAEGALSRFDSCADPGHRIEALWHERETIASVLAGVSSAMPMEELEPMAARMRLAARAIRSAKALRARMTGQN